MTSSEPEGSGGPHPLPSLYSIEGSDPQGKLVDRAGLSAADRCQIDELMGALAGLREAERDLSEASRRYMKLGESDMRALHFLIVCENTGDLATPGGIAQSLGISSASTTKLLDRLERGGHIRRQRHRSDRRALVITIEPATRAAAMRTVGAQQARRVDAARRLTADEREVVIGFLQDMTSRLSPEDAEWGASPF